MTIYSEAKVTLKYNESNGKFYVSILNLGEADEDEEDEILLPLLKDLKWNLDEPQTDEDNFAVRHHFDYSPFKDEPLVGGTAYQIDFTTEAKTFEVDKFEDYVNDILDVVEKHVGFSKNFNSSNQLYIGEGTKRRN